MRCYFSMFMCTYYLPFHCDTMDTNWSPLGVSVLQWSIELQLLALLHLHLRYKYKSSRLIYRGINSNKSLIVETHDILHILLESSGCNTGSSYTLRKYKMRSGWDWKAAPQRGLRGTYTLSSRHDFQIYGALITYIRFLLFL